MQRRLAEDASLSRIEILTHPGARRTWSDEAKGLIVLESHAPGARVVDVARRHGAAPQQVTTWRREARQGKLALPVDDDAGFALLALEEQAAPAPGPAPGLAIEIEQDGLIIRLPADTPPDRHAPRPTRRRRRSPAPGAMIVPAQAIRVVIAAKPVDFRKGHDGLAAIIERDLGLDPHSGMIVVFRSKRGDRIKILLWDAEEDQRADPWKDRPTKGLALICKRLEEGEFAWPAVRDGVMRLSRPQFEALFDDEKDQKTVQRTVFPTNDWRRVHAPRQVRRPTAAA